MYRAVLMTNTWYVVEFDDVADLEEDEIIEGFVAQGTPVVLVDDLDVLRDMFVEDIEIEMVAK